MQSTCSNEALINSTREDYLEILQRFVKWTSEWMKRRKCLLSRRARRCSRGEVHTSPTQGTVSFQPGTSPSRDHLISMRTSIQRAVFLATCYKSNMFFRNVRISPNYTPLQPIRPSSLHSNIALYLSFSLRPLIRAHERPWSENF
jgi:hypothetical protein